jgi:chemotaxis protein MotB
VDIQSSLLFNSLQATYTPQALAVLNAAAGQLKNEYRTIQVEGHCDRHLFNGQVDAETKRWELSAAQAAHVTASLAGQGIASKWLSATGMAETKPVSSSDNEFAQALNSRITLRILTAESSTQQSSNIANRQEIQPAIVPSLTMHETEPQTLPAQAAP